MIEALYFALFGWTVVYFFEFAQQAILGDPELQASASSSLMKCGLCLVGTCFTRYDGWFLTLVTLATAVAVFLKTKLFGVKDIRKFTLLVRGASVRLIA